MPASPPKPPHRRGSMTGPADTTAAWSVQAPSPRPRAPELPFLRPSTLGGAQTQSAISAALRAFSLTSAVTQRVAVDRHYSMLADDSARPSCPGGAPPGPGTRRRCERTSRPLWQILPDVTRAVCGRSGRVGAPRWWMFIRTGRADRRIGAGAAEPPIKRRSVCPAREYPPSVLFLSFR
jgi:hypothetical protein